MITVLCFTEGLSWVNILIIIIVIIIITCIIIIIIIIIIDDLVTSGTKWGETGDTTEATVLSNHV